MNNTGQKVLGTGDIIVHTTNPFLRGKTLSMEEVLNVANKTTPMAHLLYFHYRTYNFKSAHEIEDEYVGRVAMKWPTRKVQTQRLLLEKAGFFRAVRYGSKADGITKMLVGEDVVALFDAGLPHEILKPKILNDIKRKLNVHDVRTMIERVADIEKEYDYNRDKYKGYK